MLVEEVVDHLGAEASRRSSVKCGRPIQCASARAPGTACGEQQERSPSVDGSAHSSSVTATTSSPALARELRGDRAVDAAAHRDERAAAGCARSDGAPSRTAAPERAVQRVGGQVGAVAARRAQAAERVGDVRRA